MFTRGIRNNNPFNLKLTKQKWIGKVPNESNTDGTFEQFFSMKFGLRAGLMSLRTYQNKYGIYKIKDFIFRFAPPTENATSSYTNFVVNHMCDLLCIHVDKDFNVTYGSFEFYAMCQAILLYESKFEISIVDLKNIKL